MAVAPTISLKIILKSTVTGPDYLLFSLVQIYTILNRSPSLLHKPIPFNSSQNDKFLDWSKLKAFADDKIKVTEKMESVMEMVENIMGK